MRGKKLAAKRKKSIQEIENPSGFYRNSNEKLARTSFNDQELSKCQMNYSS